MKKIDTTQETATAWSPFKVESKEFLQKSYREMVDSVIRSIVITNLGTYSSTTPYVVEGCVLTNSNKDISAGIVFYGGNFYNVSAKTGGTAPLEFQLESSADGTADPTTFSDGSPHSIHLDYHFTTYSAGAAPSPTFNATALVNLYGTTTVLTGTSSNGSSITVTASSGTFTYSSDSYVYSWYINKGICFLNFEVSFTVTGGCVASKIHIPLPSGVTKLTTLSASQAFNGSASMQAPGGTTNYLTLQSFSNDGGGEGQRITLRRIAEGDTDMTISTVATTLRGSISFPV